MLLRLARVDVKRLAVAIGLHVIDRGVLEGGHCWPLLHPWGCVDEGGLLVAARAPFLVLSESDAALELHVLDGVVARLLEAGLVRCKRLIFGRLVEELVRGVLCEDLMVGRDSAIRQRWALTLRARPSFARAGASLARTAPPTASAPLEVDDHLRLSALLLEALPLVACVSQLRDAKSHLLAVTGLGGVRRRHARDQGFQVEVTVSVLCDGRTETSQASATSLIYLPLVVKTLARDLALAQANEPIATSARI